MKKPDRPPSPLAAAKPRKHFRIEKLEERIAPKKRTASPSDGMGGGKSSVY